MGGKFHCSSRGGADFFFSPFAIKRIVYVVSIFKLTTLRRAAELAINSNAACYLSEMKYFESDPFVLFFFFQ